MLRGGGQKNREDGHTGRCERQEAKANEGVGEAAHERDLHQYVWNSSTVQQPTPLPKLDRFETSRELAPVRPEKARLSLDGGGVQHEKLPHVASLAALCQAPSPLHDGLEGVHLRASTVSNLEAFDRYVSSASMTNESLR